MMQGQAVPVQRRQQRHLEVEVGHVELDLREIDRLGLAQASFHDVVPRLHAERLVLEQGRPCDANIGPADDDAIGMTTQSAARGDEAELLAVGAPVAQIEPGSTEPADRKFLEHVAGGEDAQDAAVEVAARVLRRVGDLVDQLAGAVLADAAAAEVVAWLLPLIAGYECGIDVHVDADGDVAVSGPIRRSAIDQAGLVVQVQQHDCVPKMGSGRRSGLGLRPGAAWRPGTRRHRPR